MKNAMTFSLLLAKDRRVYYQKFQVTKGKMAEEKGIERRIYENILAKMENKGTKSIMVPYLLQNREKIKESLLNYYESTEEFEKCKFITEFFEEVEKEIGISKILIGLNNPT